VEIDATHYLGKLCKRNHDHEGTGKSLRRRPSKNCLRCDRDQQRERRHAQDA
jgi:hypothetical protein